MNTHSSKGTNLESENNTGEEEDGFQKVVRRNRRIVRNVPNNAGPLRNAGQDKKPTRGGHPSSSHGERSASRSNRTVREFNREGGRSFSGPDSAKSQESRRGRGRGNEPGNVSFRKPSREDKVERGGHTKFRGAERGPGRGGASNRGRGGASNRGRRASAVDGSRGDRNVANFNHTSRRGRVNDLPRRAGDRESRGRGIGSSRNNVSPRKDSRRNEKGRLDRRELHRGKERDQKNIPQKPLRERKQRGPSPKWNEECLHKMTFYLPFNSRYLRAWIEPGTESQLPKRNESGVVKVAFRSSDAGMLQNEQGIVVTNEKWTETSPSGNRIELVRVLLPPNIRSVYEFQQSGETIPTAKKAKKASFVVDPSLVVA